MLSILLTIFANVYLDMSVLYALIVWHVSFSFYCYFCAENERVESINSASRKNVVFILVTYLIALSIGILAFLGEARIEERITSLLIPVAITDLIMSVFSIIVFFSVSQFQNPIPSLNFGGNPTVSQMVTRYDDSDLIAHDSDTYWHQSSNYTASSIDSSSDVNPASGLIMVNDAIDVAGNFYGFNDHPFSDDAYHSNQFGDCDYNQDVNI